MVVNDLLQPVMLEFRILGPLEVLDDGVPVPSADGISARCWRCCSCARTSPSRLSGSSISSGGSTRRGPRRRRCRTPSSQLRKLLGPGSSTPARPATCSSSTRISSISTRFERLVREARTAEPERGRTAARGARPLAGSPLADLESETFAQAEIHRLEDLRLGVLEERIAADLELGVGCRAGGRDRDPGPRAPAARAAARQPDAALYRSGARRRRSRHTTTPDGRWSTSSGSSRGLSSRRSTDRSSVRSARSSASRRRRSRTTTTR